MYTEYSYREYLCHHGTKGMRWGVRKYQNSDGSLTPAGKKRYNKLEKEYAKMNKQQTKFEKKMRKFEKKTGVSNSEEEFRAYLDSRKNKYHDTRSDIPREDMTRKERRLADDGSSTKVSSISKSRVRSLSDEDLNRSINRLRQEKEMKRLLNEVNHPAKTAVKKSLGSIAQKSLEEVGKKVAVSGLEYAVDRTLLNGTGVKSKNISDFSTYMRESMKKKNNGDNNQNNSDSNSGSNTYESGYTPRHAAPEQSQGKKKKKKKKKE